MILKEVKYVWAPDAQEGFLLGTVKEIGDETVSVSIEGTNKVVTAPISNVFPADDQLTKDHDDNCELMFLNEATLLHNVRLRYKKDTIYTYVANILIAVNPYHDIPHLYTKETMDEYKGVSLGVLPPHLFAIADKSYRDIKTIKQSQSIIVSGESGSGKTETTKYIIRYLTETYGQGRSGGIEKRIVESSPLLEAFGNAKTLRNLNSSRFGKYIEVHFDENVKILGAFVSHYLLEKTRICTQNGGERNYHVFYRMCAGSPPEIKSALKLQEPSYFNYLNKSMVEDPHINDLSGYELLDNAMNDVGITPKQKSDIYRIVALVLHLGNIDFRSASDTASNDVAELLGVPAGDVRNSLTTRNMVTVKEKVKVKLNADQAAAGRDALAKTIYSKVFDYIVSCVNQLFKFKKSDTYVGVLDIAGFEVFDVNGFEQFCINYCNEKLQQFFNERILKEEQELYRLEGLRLKKITFMDNDDCIELFEKKRNGIMDLLDEEMKLPTPSDEHFTEQLHRENEAHVRLGVPRKSAKIHLKDNEGFAIQHFAGAVCYQTEGFLARNNDALHENLEQLLQQSTDPFIRSLFPAPAASVKKDSNKLAFESIGKKFRAQLSLLMTKLSQTGTNFVRCIKPNDYMKSHMFEGGLILTQLQCAGMVSVLRLMQEGYPSRTPFSTLYDKYKPLLPRNLIGLDPRLFCKGLFFAVGMSHKDFAFGLQKVFFRPGKFAAFDRIMLSDPESLNQLIKPILIRIIRIRWRRAIWCSIAVEKLARKIVFRAGMLVRIQKTVRMFLAVRKHRHRYMGLIKIKALNETIGELSEFLVYLKQEKASRHDAAFELRLKQVKLLWEKAIRDIKRTVMKEKEVNGLYTDLVQKIDTLRKQLNSEKRKRLWRKVIWCAVSVQKLGNKIKLRIDMRVQIQKTVRMFLAVRKHKHRYEGLIKLKSLDPQITEMVAIAETLVRWKIKFTTKVNDLRALSERRVKKVRMFIMKEQEITSLYVDLMQSTTVLMKQLKDEAERERVERIKYNWRKVIWCAVSVQKLANKIKLRLEMRIRIQATVRMFLAVRKHRPRYRGVMKLNSLDIHMAVLKKLVKSLKKEKEMWEDKVDEIDYIIEGAIETIRGNLMKRRQINGLYNGIMERIRTLKNELYEVKAAQKEQERLEKLKEQLEVEKRKFSRQDSKIQNFFIRKKFTSFNKKIDKYKSKRRGSLKRALALSRSLPDLTHITSFDDSDEDQLPEDQLPED